MPDVETAVTPVVEVVDVTGAAPPAPKTKLSEGERLKAAAEELAKLEAKPFDPAKDKPAEGETPEEPAEPAAEAKDDQPREIKHAEWREYRKRKDKLEKHEQQFQQRAQALQQFEGELQKWDAEKKLLKSDPKAFWAKAAQEWGSDFTAEYSKFADSYIAEGQPDAKLDSAMKRIEELSSKLDEKQKTEEQNAKLANENKVIQEFVRVAIGDEFKSTAFTFRKYGEKAVVADGMAVAEHLMKTLGRAPRDTEIAAELDKQYQKHYREIVDSHMSNPQPGDAERVNGAEQSAKPVAPKAPKTLTNGGSAERASPGRKLTERERIEAAAKLLPG